MDFESGKSFTEYGSGGPEGGAFGHQLVHKSGMDDQQRLLVNQKLPGLSNTGGASTLTEFTKRKNWSQRIIEELSDFLHVLSPAGKIMYCSPSSMPLVGYAPEELIGRHITEFIHVDDIDMFVREFNMAIHTRKDFKVYYRFRRKDDKFIIFEVTGHPYFGDEKNGGVSGTPKCFFGMAQPYPTRATGMLDSFLELKIENELLQRKLRQLRAQQADENGQRERTSSGVDTVKLGPMSDTSAVEQNPAASKNSTYLYTRGVNPENSVGESLSLFTGLNYDLGERARGISTGSRRAELLTTSDFGSLMSLNGDQAGSDNGPSSSMYHTTSALGPDTVSVVGPTSGSDNQGDRKPRKKKKAKTADEDHVCTDCGTTDSPEWRKGPMGAKTLCNACGLRWSKKNKKDADDDNAKPVEAKEK
ncbi:hypothetical protein BZG36_04244 [Bifiguratus adelaidae]|uniref:White collar 2 protein n=1 Tax=Bifiguratus adelaidae TaxID=1938954 RepID=A0A261Y0U2_9FUNG|nr:hypothetical protein BZG36_04244 [Bifiguratus adelaidae]